MGTVIFPRKTDPPLVVNPDTVLSGPVPGQLFQSISWTRGEVGQGHRAIQHNQFALRRPLETRELSDILSSEKVFRSRVLEASDHPSETLPNFTTYVKWNKLLHLPSEVRATVAH